MRMELDTVEEDDQDKDLTSEEEEEWKQDDADEYDEVEADEDDEGEDIGEKQVEKNPKKQKKQELGVGRSRAAEWVEGVPISDDEEDDEEEFRLVRRQARENLRKEMKLRNNVEKSAFDQPDKWNPDQRDLDYLAEMVVSPLMAESSKWRSFHNEAPNWVKDLVLRG